VLLISGFRIFPTATGGHLRSGSIARALARIGYQVRIYSLAGRRADYRKRAGKNYLVEHIEPNLVEETHLGLGFGVLQAIGGQLHYPRVWQYSLLSHGIVPRRLRLALQQADWVISDMPWCPPRAGGIPERPWYLLSHNLEHRLLEFGNAHHRRAAAWMREVERAAPDRYRDIFACAEEDRDFFCRHDTTGRLKVPIIRNGVDPQRYRSTPGVRGRTRAELGIGEEDHLLVFSGSHFGPNLTALDSLREFGRLEAQFLARERVYILILGSMSPRPWREGALIATGSVPDVVPYLAAADAGLNPITQGSGSNVKLFEYLAAGLPVISTDFGVRGTALKPDSDYVSCTARALKDTILRFIRDRSRTEWRRYAQDVWERHRESCDIEVSVRHALAQLDGLSVPALARPSIA
jgi:glycosyltransferase involved in cell wall biosynthesis